MKITTSALTLIAATTVGLLSACGGQPALAQAETPAQIWHELVACARSHGMPDMPDPTIDSHGQAHFPPGLPQPPQSVQQACQSIYNRLPASVHNGPTPNIALATRFAQCMRAQGLSDFPDPNPDGSYALPPDLITNKTGPVWHRFKTAWDACRAFNPSNQITTNHP